MSFVAQVLVVDDSATVRALIAHKLASVHAEVNEAADGAQAMQLLMSKSFDLVILDLDMPVLNGFDLLGCIRGHPKIRHLPVVVVTGSREQHVIDAALMAGATSFLTKPFNWTAFGPHIVHLLTIAHSAHAAEASELIKPSL